MYKYKRSCKKYSSVFLPDNFNILYPHLVAGDKICIVTAAVRTFFCVFGGLICFFTVATVGETFKDYHFKLGVFHIIRFFLCPLKAVRKI